VAELDDPPSSRPDSGVSVDQFMRPGNDATTGTCASFVVMSVLSSVSCTPPLIARYFCEFVGSFGSHAAVAIAPAPTVSVYDSREKNAPSNPVGDLVAGHGSVGDVASVHQ